MNDISHGVIGGCAMERVGLGLIVMAGLVSGGGRMLV
jgi:hypothetical protein